MNLFGCDVCVQGFLRMLGKVVQSFRAKLIMKQADVRVQEPKNKGEAWAIKVSDAAKWVDFEREIGGMDFDMFKARLAKEKNDGLAAAQELVKKHAPEMAAFLIEQPGDVWNKPLILPEWRDTLKSEVAAAMVRGDDPVLEGKLPVHPVDFKIDPEQQRKADEHAAQWKSDLEQHGAHQYGAHDSSTISVPVCPHINATIRHHKGDIDGTLILVDGSISVLSLDAFDAGPFEMNTVASDAAEIPSWARGHIALCEESDGGVARVLIAESLVVIDQSTTTAAAPETETSPAIDATVEHTFIAVTTKPVGVCAPGKQMRTSVQVTLGALDDGTHVAVLKRNMNGSVMVIEPEQPPCHHYLLQPPSSSEQPVQTTVETGVISAFRASSDDGYTSYGVATPYGFFWLPAVLFVESTEISKDDDQTGSATFGQVGGDFYVKMSDGSRRHIATALKLFQPWIDHASHNRSERFRVKRKPPKGELVPLQYYARIEPTGHLPGHQYRISSLEKLCKVAEGYSAHLPSAAFDGADVNVQWTDYELDDQGRYIRKIQNHQEVLATPAVKIAMGVNMDECADVAGGRLAADSASALLEASLVDATQAATAHEVQLVLPKRTSRDARAPPSPFTLDENRVLSAVRGDAIFVDAPSAPRVGDVLLNINGDACEGSRAEVSRAIATFMSSQFAKCERAVAETNAAAHLNHDGGRVTFVVWTPPTGWSPSSRTGDPTAPDDDDGNDDDATEALPEFVEEEMRCVIRLCSRLIGGSKYKTNLAAMCRALRLSQGGSRMVMQRRLEQELRLREFDRREFVAKDANGEVRPLPSHAEVANRTNEPLNRKFGATIFRLPQIAELLERFRSDPDGDSRTGAAPSPDGRTTGALGGDAPPSFCDQELKGSFSDIEVKVSSPSPMLRETATAMPFAKRSTHSCFDAVTISWRSSSGQQQSHLLTRARDLSEGWCPVFFHEDLDELVRLRISDISVDSDSQTCLHGHCLYTNRQLPPNARGVQLPPSFIESTELADRIDQMQVPASEVVGVVRVLPTAAWRAAQMGPSSHPLVGVCHQERAFVEEFSDLRKWKTAPPKQRPIPGAVAVARRGGSGRVA